MKPFRCVLCASTLLAALGLAACGSGGGGGAGNNSATIAGKISVPGTAPIFEAEPNDSPAQAQAIGAIYPGQTIQMVGSVSAGDALDFFQIVAPTRVQITGTLSFDDSTGNAFDLGILDPIRGDVVEGFQGATSPAAGTFHARGTFLPFAERNAGSGNYTLTLVASTPADPIAEREPNGQVDQAQYLGTIEDLDHVVLSGSADALGDVDDRFVFAVPADIDLSASLAMPGGANFDVVYTDTTDVIFPVELTRFNSLVNNPETGTFSILALTMVEVAVEATSGSGAYTLTLDAVASDDLAASPRPWRRVLDTAGKNLRGALSASASPSARFASPGYESMPGEVLVLPKPGLDVTRELARRGLTMAARVPGDVMKCVSPVPEGASLEEVRRHTLALVASFSTCDSVVYAEPDIIRHAYGTTPNDPLFDLQWHYDLIQLPAAWNITQGSNSVRIGVIDTGRTNHPDLVARLINGFDFISTASIAGDGDGVDTNETDVGDGGGGQPSSFHGTHVAGTIGASTDNGSGVAGVTWLGQIMHLRVLGKGGGSTFDILNAVRHAAGLSSTAQPLQAPLSPPLDIINMSLGGPGFSQSFQNACTAAHNAGVTIFAAAGNENSSAPSFPASFNNVISVSAVGFNGVRAPYSNHNADVDIAAPGGDMTKDVDGDGHPDGVLSTRRDDSVNPPVFIFDFLQGTSMATPHAAGVAALMIAASPTPLTPDDIENILTTTATDLGPSGRDDFFGHGLINAFQAVLAASQGAAINPVLGLSTQTLSFPQGTVQQTVQVFNLGGGTLHVQPPTVTTDTGGNWLSATRIASASSSTDTSAIRINVDRTGLSDGVFTGTVTVPSDGTNGSLDIQIALEVDSSPTPPDVDIFVLVVKAGNFATVDQDVVNPSGSLKFSMSSLPAGSYKIFAGSDDDGDFILGSAGDRFFGAFPTLDQPVTVKIGNGQTLPAINFAVQTDFQGDSLAGRPPELRLLRPPSKP